MLGRSRCMHAFERTFFVDKQLIFLIFQLVVHSVPNSKRWQEISARRMEIIQTLIEETLNKNVDYIFCLDVDSKFHSRWGTESLGELVAVIHPGTASSFHSGLEMAWFIDIYFINHVGRICLGQHAVNKSVTMIGTCLVCWGVVP